MTNKGFNPLFVSALDILTGALGVFIILNFLNTRLMSVPPSPTNPPEKSGLEKKPETGKSQASVKPRPAEVPREWWRKPPPPAAPVKPQVPTQPTIPNQKPNNQSQNPQSTNPQAPPQDPVAVDLMKQTKGEVVILLQQADQAKQSVEFMLRQGKQEWRPNNANKFQDSEFKYEKKLLYFFQPEIKPGTYEVLVRVKKGQRSAGSKPFSLYGKIVPPGQKSQTYSFGTFVVNGQTKDWTPVGTFKINPSDLQYQSKVPAATKTETDPAAADPPTATQPASTPKTKPSGKNNKWS